MANLGDFLSAWAFWSGLTLAHGTVLALVTWLLCSTLLRRVQPAVLALIWTVVLVKFLVPPALPGTASLSALLSQAAARSSSLLSSSEQVVNRASNLVELPLLDSSGSLGSAVLGWQLLIPFFIVYLSCVVVGALRLGRLAVRRRRYWQSLSPADGELAVEVRRLSQAVSLSRPPQARISEDSISPYVTGFFLRPRLVLPREVLGTLSSAGRSALILHELAHIRRKDLLVRWLQSISCLLLFFWPPVRWVCRRIDRASEIACDEMAISLSGIAPEDYAGSLLTVVRGLVTGRQPLATLGFANQKTLLEERFNMMLAKNRPVRRFSWMLLPALGVWTLFALAGGAQPAQEPPGPAGAEPEHVVIHIRGNPDSIAVSAEALPEADYDQSGTLDRAELEAYAADNPGVLNLWVEEGDPSQHEVTVEVRKTLGPDVTAPAGPEQGAVERRVEKVMVISKGQADLDGDGHVSSEELESAISAGNAPSGAVWVAENHGAEPVEHVTQLHVAVESGGHSPHTVVIRRHSGGQGEEIVEIGEDEDVLFLKSEDGTVEINASGMDLGELDSDGDGQVSLEEVQKFAQEHHHEPGAGRRMIMIREHKGDNTVELTPEERRAQFLKAHPEADLDGDGQISEEESKSFAARNQELMKKPQE